MATVEELVKQYETDEALQKEVADIVADGKITLMEFMHFAKNTTSRSLWMNFPSIPSRPEKWDLSNDESERQMSQRDRSSDSPG